MAHIIAIVNHKGGVSKTTTAINLGAAMNLLGKRILIVDLDPQANASYTLGFDECDEATVFDALKDRTFKTPLPCYEVENKSNFDLCPATKSLTLAEKELGDRIRKEEILKNLLLLYKDEYDYILLDCPPNLGILTINAMSAANSIIIPINRPFAILGMGDIMQKIEELKIVNPDLKIEGYLLTDYNNRLSVVKETKQAIQDNLPAKIFNARIRHNEALSKMPQYRKDIFSYDSKSNGAEDYLQLAREITGSKKSIKL